MDWHRLAGFLVAAWLLAMGGSSSAFAQGQDELRATHGDWEVRCVSGTDTCAMSQVGNTSDGKRALLVTVQRLRGVTAEDGSVVPAAITVQTPLGILLPYGVRMKIDNNQVVPVQLSRCVPAGCISNARMLDEAVGRMKKGSSAVFGFFLDREILVNVSLRGFTKAYNSLSPVSAQ